MLDDTWIVVAGGPPAWGDYGSQATRMADAFWKLGYHVLYIECGGSRTPFHRVVSQRRQPAHSVVADLERRGFFVMRASQLPGFPFAFPEPVRRWNSARTSKRAAQFLAASGAARLIVCHYGWYLPDLFAAAHESVRHVYDCTDDHANAPASCRQGWQRRHLVRTESRLLAKADLTVFCSPELAAARAEMAGTSAQIPMGVDAEWFARPVVRDPHLARRLPPHGIGAPRIGYIGRVTERSNWAMVRAAAASTPDWQWVIAGPLDRAQPKGPENLHWLGAIRYQEMGGWLQHWDAGIVPHVAGTTFNQRSSPMKLLEYLAAGLTVASTDIPAARRIAARLPHLAVLADDETSSSFVRAVSLALRPPAWQREAGRLFARQYTWEKRARIVLELLGERPRNG